jgi:hypothetical protein
MAARPRWLKCDGRVCGGYRLHEVVKVAQGDGRLTRVAVCSACCEEKPFGICCPECGDVRFKTVTTRQRTGGITVRFKKCRHCGHGIRTKEVLESAAT